MIRTSIDAQGQSRLQSRPAAMLVQEACKYASRIWIEQGDKTVNAKSMMGVLSLDMPNEEPMVLVIEGADEKKATDALLPLIGQMFAVAQA